MNATRTFCTATTWLLCAVLAGCGDMANDASESRSPGARAWDEGSRTGGDAGFSQDPGDPGGGNTNVSFGGAQDFGYFRALVDDGMVPRLGDFDAAGFFAEHHLPLPNPNCGENVCLQPMLGVMDNLMTGANCTMLQLGLNSSIAASEESRPPLNLAVVVDVSGSMESGDKIGFVREGLGHLIDNMRDGDQLALITYSDRVHVVAEMDEVQLRRSELRSIAEGLDANGGTNLFAGLEAGYREAIRNYDSGHQNRVILLSDGNPTVGTVATDAIFDMSRGQNSEGVGLTTVGLGTDFNIELMRGLAELGDGNFYFLENSGAVSEVFSEELSYFTVPIAFDVDIELEAGSLYDFGVARGSSFWQNSGNGGALHIPSAFVAHRESHEDVTEDGGRRGGGSALIIELMPKDESADPGDVTSADVATIHFSFTEPGSDRRVENNVKVVIPHSPWATPFAGFFLGPNDDESDDEDKTRKSFVMLNIYVAFEMAVTQFYGNEPTAAWTTLERVIAGVVDYNEEVNDVDIAADLELLRALQANIARSFEPPAREDVDIPQDPWPAD